MHNRLGSLCESSTANVIQLNGYIMPHSLVPRRGKLGGFQGGAMGLCSVEALVCVGAFWTRVTVRGCLAM